MGHREIQWAACRNQRSGLELISDLRLLPSVIDDFYDLTSEQIFESTNAYWILATNYWLLFVGSEI